MIKKIWLCITAIFLCGMVFYAPSADALSYDPQGRKFNLDSYDITTIKKYGADPARLTEAQKYKYLVKALAAQGYSTERIQQYFADAVKRGEANHSDERSLKQKVNDLAAALGSTWLFDNPVIRKIAHVIYGQFGDDVLDDYDSNKAGYLNQAPIFTETIRAYLSEYKDGCWFCNIFESIYDAINNIVTQVCKKLSKFFLLLLGMGILFLILFKVGRLLFQFQEVDVMQFLNDLFKPLGRAIIAMALLWVFISNNNQTIFYLLTNPVLEVSFRMGEGILDSTLGEVKNLYGSTKTKTDADEVIQKNLSPDWSEVNQKAEEENSTPPDTALGEAPKKMMLLWMKSVSSSFIVGIALGGTFMKVGFKNILIAGGFSMFFSGFCIWLGFWILFVTVPFKLIDPFVRFAFVLALMPLWIILWVFPITQQYTKRAWEMYLSACLLFITLSIMVSIVILLANNVVPDRLYASDARVIPSSISRSDFYQKLVWGENLKATRYASMGCGMITNAIAFLAMGSAILSAAATIANSFIGGGGNVQTNVGDGVASSATRAAGVGVSMAKSVGKVAWWGGSKAVGMAKKYRDSRSSGARSGSADVPGGVPGDGPGVSPGGGPGGDSPPPVNPPAVLRGKKGDKGPDGRPGERGRPGENGPDAPDQEREGLSGSSGSTQIPTPTEAGRLAAERENELYELQGNPEAKNALLSSVRGNERRALVDMDQAIQRGNLSNTHRQALREAIIKDAQISAAAQPAAKQALEHEAALLRSLDNPSARDALLKSVGKSERRVLTDMEQGLKRGEDVKSYRETLQRAIMSDMAEAAVVQDPASAGALPRPLSEVSPERMRAIQGLAKEEGSAGNLRRLAQDVSFIEQSMGLSREDFKQAIEKHEWQTDSRKMQSFAGSLFDAKGRTIGTETVVTDMLKGTYMSGIGIRDTVKQIAQDTARGRETDLNDRTLSSSLNELSQQVATVQSQKTSDESRRHDDDDAV